MPKVNLPEGCYGLSFEDGSKVDGKSGQPVEVTDAQASAIGKSWNNRSGVLNTNARLSFGTKKGKLCSPCKRMWNAWSDTCPRCGEDTTTYPPER